MSQSQSQSQSQEDQSYLGDSALYALQQDKEWLMHGVPADGPIYDRSMGVVAMRIIHGVEMMVTVYPAGLKVLETNRDAWTWNHSPRGKG